MTLLADLKVIGEGDFKTILRWREKLIRTFPLEKEKKIVNEREKTDEEKEAIKQQRIREEFDALEANAAAKQKRQRKKEKETKAKLRIRAELGMQNESAVDMEEQPFSLADLSHPELVPIDEVDESAILEEEKEEEEKKEGEKTKVDGAELEGEEIEEEDDMLEEQMNSLYEAYLSKKQEKDLTRAAVKRSKAKKKAVAEGEYLEDMVAFEAENKEGYLDEENSSEDEDLEEELEDESEGKVEEEKEKKNNKKEKPTKENKKTLLVEFPDAPVAANVREQRFYASNPLYEEIINEEKENESVLPVMPLTDREKRKKKRRIASEKQEVKRQKKEEKEFAIVPSLETVAGADEEKKSQKKRADENVEESGNGNTTLYDERHKALIRAGMGNVKEDMSTEIEVVANSDRKGNSNSDVNDKHLNNVYDDRAYDSENEEYDLHDYAVTMSLAEKMIRYKGAKELIDSGYNRYSWNDSKDLPSWFIDDEEKHYCPQLQIPKAKLEEMKQKFVSLASKPIKKVAEARDRKRKQILQKYKQIKKTMNSLEETSEMGVGEKAKMIEKTMKKAQMTNKGKEKVYVVANKNGVTRSTQKGKGKNEKVKVVDKRMKADEGRGGKGGKGKGGGKGRGKGKNPAKQSSRGKTSSKRFKKRR